MATQTLKIVTNNQPRPLLDWHQLTPQERKEFDYIDSPEETGFARFVRFRQWVYDLHDMESSHCLPADSPLRKWHAFVSDSYFSGVVFKYTPGSDYESVICGTFYA